MIYDRIRGIGGTVMPPSPPRGEGPWPQSRIEVFAKWMADGTNLRPKRANRGAPSKTRRASPLEEQVVMMSRSDQSADLKLVVTNTLIVADIQRSVAFYRDVLGAKVLREGQPTLLRLGNIWLTINGGGGPTDDKPEVVASPPRDQNVLSIFLNLRVTDIRRYFDLWSSRGAKFITEPKVHATELRCYMRDPDGYLIEVGQTTITAGPLDLYA
jgi:catechol 2,3-dioxygenase-like lactoylglutathione lyase family enzyme